MILAAEARRACNAQNAPKSPEEVIVAIGSMIAKEANSGCSVLYIHWNRFNHPPTSTIQHVRSVLHNCGYDIDEAEDGLRIAW